MLVPLIGIMYGNVVSALTTFVAYKYDLVQTMNSWTVANFASVLQGNYEFLYLAIPASILAYFFAAQFSAASIGESFAKNIGLNYQKIVFIGVVLVAVLSSSVVMIVGVIPFLGLIVPNLVSMFVGDNMKKKSAVDGIQWCHVGASLRHIRPRYHLPLRGANLNCGEHFRWHCVYPSYLEG